MEDVDDLRGVVTQPRKADVVKEAADIDAELLDALAVRLQERDEPGDEAVQCTRCLVDAEALAERDAEVLDVVQQENEMVACRREALVRQFEEELAFFIGLRDLRVVLPQARDVRFLLAPV